MKFQITTDYAIRIMHYLSENREELQTSVVISSITGISYPYLVRIINSLRKSNLIDAVQGRNGGYILARDAEEISIYDIVSAIEGDICMLKCMNDDSFCDKKSGSCTFLKVFADLQQDVVTTLKNKTLADL